VYRDSYCSREPIKDLTASVLISIIARVFREFIKRNPTCVLGGFKTWIRKEQPMLLDFDRPLLELATEVSEAVRSMTM
jgi:hypothetical protein